MQNRLKDKNIKIVILGATSRLTSFKIIPSLYRLYSQDKLSPTFQIIGVGRREWGRAEFISHLEVVMAKSPNLQFKREEWVKFAENIEFAEGDLKEEKTYEALVKMLNESDDDQFETIVYQASLSELNKDIVGTISKTPFAKILKQKTTRIVFENPFGTSVESANDLEEELKKMISEERIYRIQHHFLPSIVDLFNETRLSNPILRELMNSDSLSQIQVTHFEEKGVGSRGASYDRAGVVRDSLQAHLLDLLSTLLYDPSIKDQSKAETELIKSLELIEPEDLIVGQYQNGMHDGKLVTSYLNEPGVERDSNTPTYVAFKSGLRNETRIIPIYVRSGKRIKSTITEILFIFKSKSSEPVNILSFRISPRPGIYITMSKRNKKNTTMNDKIILSHNFKIVDSKMLDEDEVYEKNLYKVLTGSREDFIYYQQLIEAWRFSDLINIAVDSGKASIHPYPSGTWGPDKAKTLVERDGTKWYSEEYVGVNRNL